MDKNHNLDSISEWYNSSEGFRKDWGNLWNKLSEHRFRLFQKHFTGSRALELGFADGAITRQICRSGFFKSIVGVDGAKDFVATANKTLSPYGFKGVHSLLEDFETDESFDFILASHILEHLDDRTGFLKKFSRLLKDSSSRFLIMVPNANSIHRHIGVKLGLLESNDALNDLDRQLEHKLVYSKKKLIRDAEKAGLTVNEFGGLFLKPLSNKQIEDWFDEPLMNAFFKLGSEFPELAAEIYIVCSKHP